eukprot:3553743-Ditylum_brightwellii.AAC.1
MFDDGTKEVTGVAECGACDSIVEVVEYSFHVLTVIVRMVVVVVVVVWDGCLWSGIDDEWWRRVTTHDDL